MEYNQLEQSTKEDAFALTETAYLQILNNMIDRLYRDGRYRPKCIEWETLERLQKRVKELLEDPERLFQFASKYKEGVKQDEIVEEQLMAFDKIEKEMSAEIKVQEGRDKIQVQIEKEQEERGDSQYFYLIDSNYSPQNNAESEKKQEQTFSTLVKVQENIVKNDSSESSDSPNSTFSRKNIQPDYEKFMGKRIVGMIDGNCFKYNYQKDKYTIRLTDVYIKAREGEVYLNEMNLYTVKMQKSMLPPQYQKK